MLFRLVCGTLADDLEDANTSHPECSSHKNLPPSLRCRISQESRRIVSASPSFSCMVSHQTIVKSRCLSLRRWRLLRHGVPCHGDRESHSYPLLFPVHLEVLPSNSRLCCPVPMSEWLLFPPLASLSPDLLAEAFCQQLLHRRAAVERGGSGTGRTLATACHPPLRARPRGQSRLSVKEASKHRNNLLLAPATLRSKALVQQSLRMHPRSRHCSLR